ncbi:unnamed protein product [Rotaria socialis]|uniref:Uncharacterized protein n=1 Tax=Rotaria socialis TaxID=392032 RepID=A0A817TYR3_9BILA|nr:unnamed protein product [Rotaria socialis]
MLTNHLDQNHPSPQSDPCSLNFNSVNDLDRHKLYDCEKITVQCPLQSIRCEEMIPRIHLSRYYLSDQHQKVLTKVVLRMLLNLSIQVSQTINILSDGVGNLVDELESLSTECDQLGNRLQTSIQESSLVHKSIEEQRPSIDDIKSKQETIEREIPSIIKKN